MQKHKRARERGRNTQSIYMWKWFHCKQNSLLAGIIYRMKNFLVPDCFTPKIIGVKSTLFQDSTKKRVNKIGNCTELYWRFIDFVC